MSRNYWKKHLEEFEQKLQETKEFSGELRIDQVTRILYSTDASIYQIEPLGVLFPHTSQDLQIAVDVAASLGLPVLPRGSGSSLAGQAIGEAIILDCSRYLNRCIEINPDEKYALVEPGLILTSLNRQAGKYDLQFGPDPASAERATMGGCLANNATGAHSIVYGMAVDHLLSANVILSDGSQSEFKETSYREAVLKADSGSGIESAFYKAALQIRENYADEIRAKFPQTWRRVSGYNLNYLLPWSSAKPPIWDDHVKTWSEDFQDYPPVPGNRINLAYLLAGSEGTLAVIQQAKLRLVPKPKATILCVLSFPSIASACDAVPAMLESSPSAVELISKNLITLARSVPAYASQLAFVHQLTPDGSDPEALLVVEFTGANALEAKQKAARLGSDVYLAESNEAQKQVWAVRKVGLGILMSRPGSKKPVSFIEDIAVPVEKLGTFIREIEKLLAEYNTQAEVYAHASAGCLHIRPILNLKDAGGVKDLRSIATRAVSIALSLGGAVTAEHGDGLARSEWLEAAYGPEIIQAFAALKSAADPKNIFNPGKITSPQPMDTNLRYGGSYQAEGWIPELSFPIQGTQGIPDAVELCNGAGVCRKADGVMCPSFQASQEEMYSTRGRANLLRSFLSNRFESSQIGEKAVKDTLDLCLACKGCKAECPSAVDMAKLKYEFFNRYYEQAGRQHPLRDFVFGYIHIFGQLGNLTQPLANFLLGSPWLRKASEKWLGISSQRALPPLAHKRLSRTWKEMRGSKKIPSRENAVLFLSDAFGEFFQTQASEAALRILKGLNYDVLMLPTLGAGRTLISKGFLRAAKHHAQNVIREIQERDPLGKMPIVGVEPSEIYTLRDEYLDFFPGNPAIQSLANRSWTIEEFLSRPGVDGQVLWTKIKPVQIEKPSVLFHAHCYQRACPPADDGYPVGYEASVGLLKALGYRVEVIDDGCCGVAGAFGYEQEHYAFSVKVGELALLPKVREVIGKNPDVLISASGVSCQSQIEHGANTRAYHPIELAGQLFQ